LDTSGGRLLPGGGAIGHKNRKQAGEGKYDGTDDIVLKEKTGSPDEEEESAQKVGQDAPPPGILCFHRITCL